MRGDRCARISTAFLVVMLLFFLAAAENGSTALADETNQQNTGEDFAIQNAITSTQADGLIVYGELNTVLPRYRTWNSSNNFSAEQNAQTLTSGDITWVVVRGNHERDEIILGTEDKDNDVNIQVYNASAGTWGALLEVSADIFNSNSRGFDIAVEDLSGEVLIAYEDSSTADTQVRYRTWNGTGYSSQQTLVTGLPSSPIRWVRLVPRAGSDDMMLLAHNNAGDLHAFPWNGTEFDTTAKNLTLSLSTTSNTNYHFGFDWETQSGQGLAVYGEGSNLVYRTYSPTAPHWSVGTSISLGQALNSVRFCSDPSSDHIGFIWIDGGNDVNVRMWDGTQLLAFPPAEDNIVEPEGANNGNIDCAWYNSTDALFGFADQIGGGVGNLNMSYFTFTKSNTWSVADLTTAPTTYNFASDDIESLRFTKHPTTSEIMITAMDIAEDITLIRWNGSGFRSVAESPVETDTEVLNGAQEGAGFEYSRYDPKPNVTNITPSGTNFAVSTVINITANVTDNILVDNVVVNITLPNGSYREINLVNRSKATYNSTFSETDLNGEYTINIIANDTSVHQNVNSSETVTFTIGDAIPPAVTNLTPASGSSYDQNTVVNISVNVTDASGVDTVLANVTLPNGSINQLTLTNISLAGYNGSFRVTNLVGTTR